MFVVQLMHFSAGKDYIIDFNGMSGVVVIAHSDSSG